MKAYEFKIMRISEAETDYKARTPCDMAAFWKSEVERAAWFDPEKEAFVVVCLSVQHHVKAWNLCSLGILNASIVHPREVFRPAIACCAAAILLAHNHPSGDPTPSAEDLRITRRLCEAGQILDIKVLDHIIMGSVAPGFVSMRDMGMMAPQ